MRAVRVESVAKRLGGRVALRAISCEVATGATLGVIGPSGSGKTTLLRLIAGLDAPDQGQIWLGDRLVSSAGRIHVPPFRRNIGFVFQDLALWPHMTVAGNLLFVLESRGWPSANRKTRVAETLKIVGLADRAGEHPGHLSGGEQQRVALARALVGRPDLLLMDEPLSSLDPDRRAALRDEMAAIPRTFGIAMIYVSHDRADIGSFGGDVLEVPGPQA